jgi:hypothetical protein
MRLSSRAPAPARGAPPSSYCSPRANPMTTRLRTPVDRAFRILPAIAAYVQDGPAQCFHRRAAAKRSV